jgi:hypothetical protein
MLRDLMAFGYAAAGAWSLFAAGIATGVIG